MSLDKLQARIRGYRIRNDLIIKLRVRFLAMVSRLESDVPFQSDKIIFPRNTICKPQTLMQQPTTMIRQPQASEAEILRELEWARATLRSRLDYLESQP